MRLQPFSHSAIQPFSHSAIQPFSQMMTRRLIAAQVAFDVMPPDVVGGVYQFLVTQVADPAPRPVGAAATMPGQYGAFPQPSPPSVT
jgi:hypothetical protein